MDPPGDKAEREFMSIDPTIIDPAALKRLEEWGGTKLSKEIIRLFLDNGPVRVDQIRGAMDEDDLEVPERGAHSLKSSAANVGAQQLQDIASELELAASGGDLQRVRDLIPNLEQAYARAAGELAVIVEEEGNEA
jgi:HPt (histidine-containing phosphotransfer) domain-containing protein